jgi:NTE family protein
MADTALARLFAQEHREGDAAWFSLPGGATLYAPGEAADYLYFLRTGRLGAFRREEGQEPQFLGVIRPGEPAGEMAMIAGSPHSANLVALRDSGNAGPARAAFFEAVERDPAVMIELSRLMILRARNAGAPPRSAIPSVFGFIASPSPASRGRWSSVSAHAIEPGLFGHRRGGEACWPRPNGSATSSATTTSSSTPPRPGRPPGAPDRPPGRPPVPRRPGPRPRPPPVIPATPRPLQDQKLVDLVLLQPSQRHPPKGSRPGWTPPRPRGCSTCARRAWPTCSAWRGC